MKKILMILLCGITGIIVCLNAEKASAQNYSFAFGGFANGVHASYVDSDQVANISDGITDYMVDELMDCPEIELYDTSYRATQARIDEMATQFSLAKMPAEYKEINADYIICGTLSGVGVTMKDNHVLVVDGGSHKVRVDLYVRVFERATGNQIFVATGTGWGESSKFNLGIGGIKLMKFGDKEFSEECYSVAMKAAVKQVAEKIKQAI